MKMLACVVPRLLDAEERRYQFIDQNGRIDDPMELYRQTRDLPRWDDKAKSEFTGAFVENPKLWHKIAPRVKANRFSIFSDFQFFQICDCFLTNDLCTLLIVSTFDN